MHSKFFATSACFIYSALLITFFSTFFAPTTALALPKGSPLAPRVEQLDLTGRPVTPVKPDQNNPTQISDGQLQPTGTANGPVVIDGSTVQGTTTIGTEGQPGAEGDFLNGGPPKKLKWKA